MLSLLFLLLPVAALSGWYAGNKQRAENLSHKKKKSINNFFHSNYLIGLDHLVNDNQDKALDVFIKMLEVNDDTVETHLALGSLFRRRGEVERAIRIHQNIIARANLDVSQKSKTLLELGKDYLRAGVLDRAENIFHELNNTYAYDSISYKHLLDIYELQKDWNQAIITAKKIETLNKTNLGTQIAHYYCELAEEASMKKEFHLIKDSLKNAVQNDKNCVRAMMLCGQLALQDKQYKTALLYYLKVGKQDKNYLSKKIIENLSDCYNNLGQKEKFVNYLQNCLKKNPQTNVIIAMAEQIRELHGNVEAINFLIQQMEKHVSLRMIDYLLTLNIQISDVKERENFEFLQKSLAKILDKSQSYTCSKCGFSGTIFYWQCPSCHLWNTIKHVE